MDIDPSMLVDEGSKVLVQEMTKNGWELVKSGFARFFGRGTAQEGTLAELEDSRQEVVGDPDLADDAVAVWRFRLRQHLRTNPGAAEELRALLEEVAPDRGGTTNIMGDVNGGVAIQAGRIGQLNHNTYQGDHVDMRGARAGGDVIGTQNDHGRDDREN